MQNVAHHISSRIISFYNRFISVPRTAIYHFDINFIQDSRKN